MARNATKKDDGKKGPSPIKKSVRKIPIKPSGKAAVRFIIRSIQTLVPEIIVSYCSRVSDESIGAFIKPMTDKYAEDVEAGGSAPHDFNVQYICSRRAIGAGNVPKKVSMDQPYEWEALITIIDEGSMTANAVGENLAEQFSAFKSEKYETQGFKFVSPNESDVGLPQGQPLNYYLLDWDCVVLLRNIYSETTKEDLMDNEEIMNQFFGSIDGGEAVLSNVSQMKWESIF